MACAILHNISKDMRQPEAVFNVQEDKLLHIYSDYSGQMPSFGGIARIAYENIRKFPYFM